MQGLGLILLCGLALPAFADHLPLPSNMPASYKTECGSCHLAFPPALLSAADWQRTMSGLNKHFGTDATVTPRAALEIGDFLKKNAGDEGRLGRAGDPPRITRTARFLHKHDEVPAKFWRDPRIKSAANCEACHQGAAAGRYSEHDLAIPGLHR